MSCRTWSTENIWNFADCYTNVLRRRTTSCANRQSDPGSSVSLKATTIRGAVWNVAPNPTQCLCFPHRSVDLSYHGRKVTTSVSAGPAETAHNVEHLELELKSREKTDVTRVFDKSCAFSDNKRLRRRCKRIQAETFERPT